VMGAEAAVNVVFRREIAADEDQDAARARVTQKYKSELLHPFYAAERGLVDDVIDPADTRQVLVDSLAMLRTKRLQTPTRKHGNPPQ
jgi:acetyl-CoA carboxylase carboxyltransferase component